MSFDEGGAGGRSLPEILLPTESEEDGWENDGGGGRGKVKLTRCDAIRDSASPPPPTHAQTQTHSDGVLDDSSIVNDGYGCDAAGGDAASVTDSGRGDTDTPEGEAQYTDSTGIDLTQFIINTLNKNIKDRVLMLKLEQEMTNLVKDTKRTHHKFPHMSSYHRMLVHRVAAYFGLDHNVDQTGNCVIVNKTKTTRLPDMKFREHVPDEPAGAAAEPKKLILKRESCSCDSADSLSHNSSSRRSKSIEEREEEYEKARKRIFNEICNSHVHMKPLYVNLQNTKGGIHARSFDMRDSMRDSADRPAVSKSFSFGGYPAAQHLEPHKGPKGPSNHPPTLNKGQVVWAVTDVTSVPKGSVLINPDTGTPFLNSDGSVYLYDPHNPPRVMPPGEDGGQAAAQPQQHQQSGMMLAQDLSKLSLSSLEGEVVSGLTQQVVWPGPNAGSWMLPHPGVQSRVVPHPGVAQTNAASSVSPAPYILVNPVSSLPHYVPYLSPYPQGGYIPPPAPPSDAPSQEPAPPPPAQYVNMCRPYPMFSLHRSPTNNVILFLQSCPALLTRAQLQTFLDNFMTAGTGGVLQFLDPSGKWSELSSFCPDTVVTNRFPIQVFFETEEIAAPTVAALKSAGYLTMDPSE